MEKNGLLTNDEGDLINGGDGEADKEATHQPGREAAGEGSEKTRHLLQCQAEQE